MKGNIQASIAVALLLSGPRYAAGDFHGRVIDSETRKPIAGAAVVFAWTYESVGVHFEHYPMFYEAREAVTDVNGEFSVSDSTPFTWNPLKHINDLPDYCIFVPYYLPSEPGYAQTIPSVKEPTWTALLEALRSGAVVELRRIRTPDQYERFSTLCELDHVPDSAVPQATAIRRQYIQELGLAEPRSHREGAGQ